MGHEPLAVDGMGRVLIAGDVIESDGDNERLTRLSLSMPHSWRLSFSKTYHQGPGSEQVRTPGWIIPFHKYVILEQACR